MLSAFGASENPTKLDPTSTCTNFANYALNMGYDGVDIDYEDNGAMYAGTGEAWLISCT